MRFALVIGLILLNAAIIAVTNVTADLPQSVRLALH